MPNTCEKIEYRSPRKNTERSIYRTVRYSTYRDTDKNEYHLPTQYRGNHLPYRLFFFEIPSVTENIQVEPWRRTRRVLTKKIGNRGTMVAFVCRGDLVCPLEAAPKLRVCYTFSSFWRLLPTQSFFFRDWRKEAMITSGRKGSRTN